MTKILLATLGTLCLTSCISQKVKRQSYSTHKVTKDSISLVGNPKIVTMNKDTLFPISKRIEKVVEYFCPPTLIEIGNPDSIKTITINGKQLTIGQYDKNNQEMFRELLIALAFVPNTGKTQSLTINPSGTSVTINPSGNSITISSSVAPDNFIRASSNPLFKADFERISNITISGNSVTSSKYFTIADTGKIIAIFSGRSYTAYRQAPITLNARIVSTSGGVATIAQEDAEGTISSGSGKTGYVATDNWQPLQECITLAENSAKFLYLDFNATAYISPLRHPEAAFNTRSYGLKVGKDVKIYGNSKTTTFLKWGMEDIMITNHVLELDYVGFRVGNCVFSGENFSMLAPDRASTELDNQNIFAIRCQEQQPKQSVYFNNVNILSNNIDLTGGWGQGVYMNNSTALQSGFTATLSFKNGRIEAQAGVSFFNAATGVQNIDTAHRVIELLNSVIYSGARYSRMEERNITMSTMSDVITVSNSPTFSFYDFVEYENFGTNVRTPNITIVDQEYTNLTLDQLGPSHAFVAIVNQVISPTIAKIRTDNVPQGNWRPNNNTVLPTFSTNVGTMYTSRFFQDRWAAFHSVYRSGNVGSNVLNTETHSLRYVRNTQNYRSPTYVEVFDASCVRDISYPPAETLRLFLLGPGNGSGTGSAQECGIL